MEGRPSPCRFTPTCSSYAIEALHEHGTLRGLWLTVRRLLRCRPFGPSGWDPVPLSTRPGDEARPILERRSHDVHVHDVNLPDVTLHDRHLHDRHLHDTRSPA